MRSAAVRLGVVAAVALWAGQAQAHKLHVFAALDGKVIRGEAYFRGGGAAAGVPVQALGPGGEPLGQTTTDSQGKFSLPARFRCEHRLVFDAGGGHVGEYRLSAQQLPADLPPLSQAVSPDGTFASALPSATLEANPLPAAEPVEKEPPPNLSSGPLPRDPSANLIGSIEAVRTQMLELRAEFDAFRQETRLRDVLGGVGYILGLMGVVLYVVNRRRTSQS